MALNCTCPVGAAIPTIPSSDCIENLGQIQKLILVRTKDSDGGLNSVDLADAIILATWETLKAAIDSTKAVVTPFINNPTASGGEARTYGTGNQVVDGVPIVLGSDPVTMTAQFLQTQASVLKELKKLNCEKLSVFLIAEGGKIVGNMKDGDEENIYPIALSQFFIGDRIPGGFESPDMNNISFAFYQGWDDNLKMIEPEFDALVEL